MLNVYSATMQAFTTHSVTNWNGSHMHNSSTFARPSMVVYTTLLSPNNIFVHYGHARTHTSWKT